MGFKRPVSNPLTPTQFKEFSFRGKMINTSKTEINRLQWYLFQHCTSVACTGIAISPHFMKVYTMAMSKKDMDRRKVAKKGKMEELEKLASAGSKDAKKKLAKEKKKK